MRVVILTLGCLAGAIIATTVHAQQATQSDGNNGNASTVQQQSPDDSARARYESMLHGGGSDRFSASRKMQGSQFYASGSTNPKDNARNSDAPAWQPDSSGNASSQVTANQPQQRITQSDAGVPSAQNNSGGFTSQTIRPSKPEPIFGNFPLKFGQSSGSTNSPQPRGREMMQPPARVAMPPAMSSSPPVANTITGSGAAAEDKPIDESNDSGLSALQQRLAKMRKASSGGESPKMDMPPPVAESGIPLPAVPPTTSIMSQRLSTVGPENGPSAPMMPALHVSSTPPANDQDNSQVIENTTIADATAVSSAAGPIGPVVSGPLSASHRHEEPTPAQEPDHSQTIGQIPIAGQSISQNSAKTTFGAPQDYRSSSRYSDSAIKQYVPQTVMPTDAPHGVPTPARAAGRDADGVLFARESPLMGVETVGPRSITVGKEAAYGVTITNAGEFAAQDVVVSINIPQWAEVVAVKSESGGPVALPEQPGDPVIWHLSRLEPRSKDLLSVRLIPRESRPFDLSVQWTCSPAASQAMVEVKEPKLALSLDGPPEVIYGQSKVYRLTISNPGTGDAEKVVLMLAPVDGSDAAPTRHDVGLIRAGENKSIEMELAARQTGALTINAVAVAEGNVRAEVNEEILVRRPGLKIATSGPEAKYAGTAGTYSIAVTNPGNAAAKNISVAAALPPGSKYVSSTGGQFDESENKVVWNIPSLRPGAEQEFELRCAMTTPGSNRLQIEASGANDLHDAVAAVTEVQAVADLKLEVIDPPGPLPVGEDMVYEIHIRNRGSKAAENVDVVGFFSRGLEPITAQGADHEVAPGQIVFKPIDSIPASSEVVLKIKARADQPGNHVFRAEVTCQAAGAKLASEETELFYGDGREPTRTAARPNIRNEHGVAPSSGSDLSPAPIKR